MRRWHSSPSVQFVVTLQGAWFVNTTDGGYVEMREGDVLFQDDFLGNAHGGKHYSGTLNNQPCNQLVVAVELERELPSDDLCDF